MVMQTDGNDAHSTELSGQPPTAGAHSHSDSAADAPPLPHDDEHKDDDPNGGGDDGDYDPNDPKNREEEEEDDDDGVLADDLGGDADHDGDAVMAGATAAGARPTVRTKSAHLPNSGRSGTSAASSSRPPILMATAASCLSPCCSLPSPHARTRRCLPRSRRSASRSRTSSRRRRTALTSLSCSQDGHCVMAALSVLCFNTPRTKEHRKINTSVALSHSTGMWFNHVDAQALATFKERAVSIVDAKSATANKIPPLPDRAEPNIHQLGKAELPDGAIALLFANSHYDGALLKQAEYISRSRRPASPSPARWAHVANRRDDPGCHGALPFLVFRALLFFWCAA